MEKPEISIIIPTLQEGDYLGKLLDDLRRDLKKIPYEIIVSDGGSIDDTLKIARKYNVRIVENTKKIRQTIALGRNLGAKVARGKYLVFLEGDSIIPNPDFFFSEAIKSFENQDDLVALTVNVLVHPDKQRFSDWLIYSFLNKMHILFNNVFKLGKAFGEFQMYRALTFKKVRGYREDLIMGEDHELFGRISKVGKTKMNSKLTMYHSGRRARKLGWFGLLWAWMIKGNRIKEWEVIR